MTELSRPSDSLIERDGIVLQGEDVVGEDDHLVVTPLVVPDEELAGAEFVRVHRVHQLVEDKQTKQVLIFKSTYDAIWSYFVSAYPYGLDKPSSRFHCGNVHQKGVGKRDTNSIPSHSTASRHDP